MKLLFWCRVNASQHYSSNLFPHVVNWFFLFVIRYRLHLLLCQINIDQIPGEIAKARHMSVNRLFE